MNGCNTVRSFLWSTITNVSSCQPISNVVKSTNSISRITPSIKCARPYSSVFKSNVNTLDVYKHSSPKLLSPVLPKVNIDQPNAGMKHVNNPKRRCKHCYIVIEDERKFVFCDKYPRHKQAQKRILPIIKVSRIMTHATQGGRNSSARMGMWTQQGLREDY